MKAANRFIKAGGLPDVPPGFIYPKDKQGKSAVFIAQLHIVELNPGFESTKEFKGNGILYFFGRIKITNNTYFSFKETMVRYSARTNDLKRLHLPDDIMHHGSFKEMDLAATEEINIPPYDSSITHHAGFNEEELSSFMEFDEIIETHIYYKPPSGSYYNHIQFRGYPQQLQDCLPVEAV